MEEEKDEWDALERKVAADLATAAEVSTHTRAAGSATEGRLPTTPRPLPYRTLASIVDLTTGEPGQTLRIVSELDPTDPVTDLDTLRPRLDCAQHWVAAQPIEQRTQVRAEADLEALSGLDDDQRAALALLLAGLDTHWSLDGLTTLVYGVPKQRLGLAMDVKPTAELKAAQRAFFALLYRLLVSRETGPRLPTLLLAVGAQRVRELLTAP